MAIPAHEDYRLAVSPKECAEQASYCPSTNYDESHGVNGPLLVSHGRWKGLLRAVSEECSLTALTVYA